MGERDRHEHGTFSWTDLSTPDAEASKAFYGGLFDWEFEDNPIPEGGVYVMAKLGGRAAAAMFETTRAPPGVGVVRDRGRRRRDHRARAGARRERDRRAVRRHGRGADVDAPGPDRRRLLRVAAGHEHRRRGGERAGRAQPEPAQHHRPRGRAALLHRPVRLALRGGAGRHRDAVLGHLPRRARERRDDAAAAGRSRRRRTGSSTSGSTTSTPPPSGSRSSGGRVVVETMDVPGGQILVAQDPQGAIFALFAGRFDD